MKTFWGYLTQPRYIFRFTRPEVYQGGPITMLLGVVALHFEVVYALVTGNIVGWSIVEGRHSLPILYWIYVIFLVAAVTAIDTMIFHSSNPKKPGPPS